MTARFQAQEPEIVVSSGGILENEIVLDSPTRSSLVSKTSSTSPDGTSSLCRSPVTVTTPSLFDKHNQSTQSIIVTCQGSSSSPQIINLGAQLVLDGSSCHQIHDPSSNYFDKSMHKKIEDEIKNCVIFTVKR